MRQVVTILVNTPTDTDSGGATDSYSTLLVTRGRLRQRYANREMSFGEAVENENYELIIRYQDAIASNMSVDMKFSIDGKVYSLSSWELVNEIKDYYRFKVTIHKSATITA